MESPYISYCIDTSRPHTFLERDVKKGLLTYRYTGTEETIVVLDRWNNCTFQDRAERLRSMAHRAETYIERTGARPKYDDASLQERMDGGRANQQKMASNFRAYADELERLGDPERPVFHDETRRIFTIEEAGFLLEQSEHNLAEGLRHALHTRNAKAEAAALLAGAKQEGAATSEATVATVN